jgi:putative heme-binding domain-containing protein
MSRRVLALLAIASLAAGPPRQAWVTSHVVGSPDPPPAYRTINVFPNVKLTHPLLLAFAPGGDRFFVAEQAGRIVSIANRPDAVAGPFLDLAKEYKSLKPHPGAKSLEAVYGLVFHPKFAENRYCYVCYTLLGKKDEKNLPEGTRLSRFTVSRSDPPTADPASEQVILTWLQGGHNGGDLHFGPDGMLYISTGDATDPNPPDKFKVGQDVSSLLSKILRIDVDHADGDRSYAIPKDNPFVDSKGARPEVWAFGFRNPWRMSFDRKASQLWVGDVGWELWESVHRVERGGNYGWSIMEGRQPVNTDLPVGPTPIRAPVFDLPHTMSASLTGGYVYRGKKFPELEGAYIFGDWETKRIWAARIEGDRLKSLTDLVEPTLRVVAFGQNRDGELYVVDYDAGTIHALEPNPSTGKPANFPRTLSATGLFASVKDQFPAEGVLPFSVNAAQWCDGATAERFVALPDTSSIVWHPKDMEIPGSMFSRQFVFPNNSVLARTFSLELERGNPASRKRIETQLLHFDGKQWRAYSYAWNADGSDADLVTAEGREQTFVVRDTSLPGGKRELEWSFAARAQCLVCHTPWAQTTLAFNVAQLNRGDQLRNLEDIGVLRRVNANGKPLPPLTAADLRKQPTLCDPADATRDLDLRARSYLHANCGHCHRFGGGGSVDMELHAFAALEKTKTVEFPPHQGGFDLPNAKIIAPGAPERSTLYYRLAKFGRGRMPRLASDWPDEAGLRLVHEWISRLDKSSGEIRYAGEGGWEAASPEAADIERGLADPASALPFGRLIGRNALPRRARDEVLARAAKLSPGPVRDLFEGFFPSEGRERKLGANPRPPAILALKGDTERGRAVYFATGMTCQNCHRVEGRGNNVGPELTAIGKTRAREDLLDSILEPSRRIEPQFVAYNVETKAGKLVTGLLIKRDATEVVIRDAQNQDLRLRPDEVTRLEPSRLSLMPDGLLRDLTAQQAADLLEFLVTRR